ncbi:MAG: DUF6036 family nucleotidyltransferase [Verrucomicrobiaceae bacterium]
MNSDFKELLQVFNAHEVKYLIVGGYAAIHYSQPRYTKDLDLWIEPSLENARKIAKAFHVFGLPIEGFKIEDMADTGFQFFVGCPPCAFDFLTSILGLEFSSAWEKRVASTEDDIPVWYVSKEDLVIAKKAVSRDQDLKDIEEIERADSE